MQFDSSPRIVFGKEQKPVLKAKGKSVFLKSAGTNSQIPSCPKGCRGKVWQQGHWKKHLYEIQRWMCCECGYIFSDPKQLKEANKKLQRVETIESMELKSPRDIDSNCQIRVKETKNLGAEEKTICIPQKHEKEDLKGAVISFIWHLKRQNYAEDTLYAYGYNLQALIKLGIDLFDPQNFIDKMSQLGDSKTNIRKYNLAKAYKAFLNYNKIKADIPKYKFKRPLPYVPPEAFLDQLIASAGSNQLSTFMQTLKETGARPGEAFRLEWTDIDIANKTINISHPEKGCNPRILPISDKLLKMIQELPHAKANFIFNYKNKHVCGQSFRKMRKRAIKKLGNLEFAKIDFYTFRYWRATEEYDLSHKDFEAVMYLLGHNSLRYVLLYKQLSKARRYGATEKYIVKEAKTKKQEIELLEDGFEWVKDRGKTALYRKLKP